MENQESTNCVEQSDRDTNFISHPHFIAGCINRFKQITKQHIGFILGISNRGLRNTIEYLDDEELPVEHLLAPDNYPELSYREEKQLMTEYWTGKDTEDKELLRKRERALIKLIEGHKPIFERIALKLDPTGRYTDDLVQEGLWYFTKSLDKKEEGRRSRVIRFTLKMAFYRMERYLYMNKQSLYLSHHSAENLIKLKKILDEFEDNLPFDNLIELICEKFGVNEKEALEYLFLYDQVDTEIEPDSLSGATESQFLSIERAHLRKKLNSVLNKLSPMQEAVIRLRIGYFPAEAVAAAKHSDKHTLREIGEIYGLSRERPRQIESKALEKLRRFYIHRGLEEFWPMREDEKKKNKKECKKAEVEPVKPITKHGFKSDVYYTKFLRIEEGNVIILKMHRKEVQAVTISGYAPSLGLSYVQLKYRVKKAKIKPIKGVKISFWSKFMPLFLKDEIDKLI